MYKRQVWVVAIILSSFAPIAAVLSEWLFLFMLLAAFYGCFGLGVAGWRCANDHIDSVKRGYLNSGLGMVRAGKVLSVVAVIASTPAVLVWTALLAALLAGLR